MVQALDDMPRPLDHLPSCGLPEAPAIEDRAGMLDYRELDRAVGALATALLGQGVVPGARVASWLAKTRLACLMPLACARAGIIHVPINPLLKHAQVSYILSDSEAALLIAGETRLASLEGSELPGGCATAIEGEQTDGWIAQHDVMPPSAHAPDLLAALLYTSGSTGRPKGVMLSHANLWLGAVSVAHYLRLYRDTRTLCVLPFAFDYGQNQLLSTWAAGGCAIPLDYLTPRDVVRSVDRYAVNTLAGVPPLWTQLVETQWPETIAARLRCLTNSGGRMAVPLVRKLRALFPEAAFHSMYGLTEAFRSTSLDPALVDAHPDAIGTGIPFAEIMVVRPDGQEVAPDEAGELVHAGPLVALGYWRDSDRTALRFRPAPAHAHHGGLAVWSGDTVVRGRDGLLRFVGRDDAMIKTAGNRVSPTEIEEAAIASGATSEAVALGVSDEKIGAAIVLVAQGDGLCEECLRSYLKKELPNFMQPRSIIWKKQLPHTPNGKLDRAAIIAEQTA